MRLAPQAVPDGLDHRSLLISSASSVPPRFKDFWVAFPITAITPITGVPSKPGFGLLGWDHARSPDHSLSDSDFTIVVVVFLDLGGHPAIDP
jgi:hypothetical protein